MCRMRFVTSKLDLEELRRDIDAVDQQILRLLHERVRLVLIFCYYHGQISDDDREEMSCVQTEVATDFVDLSPVHFDLERLDMPMKMNGFRSWVFLRKE